MHGRMPELQAKMTPFSLNESRLNQIAALRQFRRRAKTESFLDALLQQRHSAVHLCPLCYLFIVTKKEPLSYTF